MRSEDRWREGLRTFDQLPLSVLTAFLVTGVLALTKTRSSHDNIHPGA